MNWTFLTNHSHVLTCLATDPQARLRDVAAQKIVADQEEAEVIARERHGRRNHYRIHPQQPLRHPVEAHRTVRDLLRMVAPKRRQAGRS